MTFAQTKEPWIGEIPDDWRLIKLKRLVSTKITDGPHETPELEDDGVQFISAEAIKNGRIDFNLRRGFISLKLHQQYSRKCKPQRGDIFVIKSGATTGNVAYVDVDFEFSVWSPLAVIRCDQRIALYKFVYYVLLTDVFRKQVELSWSFGTQQNIGMGVIERLKVPIPSICEQKRIASFLDISCAAIDEAVAAKREQLDTLDELRMSVINSALTKGIQQARRYKFTGVDWFPEIPEEWEVTRFKSLFDEIYRYPTYFNIEYVEQGIPEIRGEALTIEGFIQKLPDERYISEETNSNFPRTQLRLGDIVMSVRGTMGKVGLVDERYVGANITANLLRLSPNPRRISGAFLRWVLRSKYFNDALNSSAPQTTIKTITMPQLAKLPIAVPPTKEQLSIQSYLEDKTEGVDRILRLISRQIETLVTYRKSLIHECVTGQRRITEADFKRVQGNG